MPYDSLDLPQCVCCCCCRHHHHRCCCCCCSPRRLVRSWASASWALALTQSGASRTYQVCVVVRVCLFLGGEVAGTATAAGAVAAASSHEQLQLSPVQKHCITRQKGWLNRQTTCSMVRPCISLLWTVQECCSAACSPHPCPSPPPTHSQCPKDHFALY